MRGLMAREPSTGTVEIPRDPGAPLYRLDLSEGAQRKTLTIAEGMRLVLGSRAPCDVIVEDPTVSSRHCRLACSDGRLTVEDLGSRNGLVVGSARVKRAELGPGSFFLAGRVLVAVRAGDCASTSGEVEPLPGIIGRSEPMLQLARDVRRLACLRFPVVIRGETGSGKELVARALHQMGPRAEGPLVAVNAAALPRELAESELFGYERGAFTGAYGRHEGAFVQADHGTLFLDEVGDLSPEIQVRLLRALEQSEVRPLGGSKATSVDVRVIAATWAPLEAMVVHGRFREDLYHRLAVATVIVPPLRDRRVDIPDLARHFLREATSDADTKTLSIGAIARLVAERWPGNVRQLKNVVTRAAVASSGEMIGSEDIAKCMGEQPVAGQRMTRRAARALVAACGGSVSAAARRSGVPRSTFRGWIGE